MAITTYLNAYRALFVGRSDDYAKQLTTGRYQRVGKPLTDQEVYNHLVGTRSYGTYVMNAVGLCRFAVIDADTEDGLDQLWKIRDQLAAQRIVSYVEQSRRGGHLWVFFTVPTPASQVRAWLLPFCPPDMEFYPKQEEGKGYGSLIRLPLGVHRKSHERYHFVERSGSGLETLTRTDDDRGTWFASIQRMDVPQMVPRPVNYPRPISLTVSQPPRMGSGGPSPIRQWNAQQDPIDVIGRYVDLRLDHTGNEGVGKCPFGDHHTNGQDTQASFKVYKPGAPGGYCWYCYTWQQGGSVFDFLRYYHDLDAKTLWEQIQEESIL